jgi:hypothetical protein
MNMSARLRKNQDHSMTKMSKPGEMSYKVLPADDFNKILDTP